MAYRLASQLWTANTKENHGMLELKERGLRKSRKPVKERARTEDLCIQGIKELNG